jgi:hypothetical protein
MLLVAIIGERAEARWVGAQNFQMFASNGGLIFSRAMSRRSAGAALSVERIER